jgi:hypothetical protein
MYKSDNCEKCNTSYFKCGAVDGAILNVDECKCKCECGPGYWGIGVLEINCVSNLTHHGIIK